MQQPDHFRPKRRDFARNLFLKFRGISLTGNVSGTSLFGEPDLMRRVWRIRLAAVVCLFAVTLVGISSCGHIVQPSSAPPDESFSIVLLPDTQCYSSSGALAQPGSCGAPPNGDPKMMASQTDWIVANQSSQKIAAVIGLGDLTQCAADAEWKVADASYRTLDNAGLPYLVVIGNHDYDAACKGALTLRKADSFNSYFGKSRFSSYAWYGASTYPATSNENSYMTFDVGPDKLLVIGLELFPRDTALAWAKSVIEANSDRLVIVATHAYLGADGGRIPTTINAGPKAYTITDGNDGEAVWSKFVSQYPNIIAVVNGHAGSNGGNGATASRSDMGSGGTLVAQMLSNYQWVNGGGYGYLRLINIQPAKHLMVVKTYSPYLNQWFTDSANQFTISYGVAQ
jgi:hypothetical protein